MLIKNSFSTRENINLLISSLGWDANVSTSQVSAIQAVINLDPLYDNIESIIKDIETANGNEEQLILDLITGIKSIYSFFDSYSGFNISVFPFNQAAFWMQFIADYFSYIIVKYIYVFHAKLHSILALFDVIRVIPIAPIGAGRKKYDKYSLNTNAFFNFFTDPSSQVKSALGWTSTSFNSDKLLKKLSDLLLFFNAGAELAPSPRSILQSYFTSSQINNNFNSLYTSLLNVYGLSNISGALHFGFSVTPVPKIPYSGLTTDGVIVAPFLLGSLGTTIPINSKSNLKIQGNLGVDDGMRIGLFPGSTTLDVVDPNTTIDGSIIYEYDPRKTIYLIGDSESTSISINGFYASLRVHGLVNDIEVELQFGTSQENYDPISIRIFPGKGDNFISKILGDKPISIDLDGSIRWSSKNGFKINGNVGFSFQFPLHIQLGPISIEGLTISPSLGSGGLKIGLGADFKLEIGALTATINNIGAKLIVRSGTSSSSGAFGKYDVEWAFKSPTGVGIAINSSAVTGGGFLNYDEDKFTYTGGLELKFSKISLCAIGILTTKMPDGSNGYSLLIIITAEFTPIQLGMGFTLNGVGGLLGLHRTINVERLKSGVKDKTLESILFPRDIVKNASAIISNLNQVFPVKKDRFLIGPMAKIGWGTPTLITIELGVIIEMPSPVLLAIVGIVKVVLPAEASPVLKLQINFVGIVDFEKKQLSFDASLYDSSILSFPLTGDMALRLYWGEKPNFLMSVGGFHPKFTPPPMNLPQLQRLALQLAKSDNLSIRVETYFAVTSNSVQFGARVDARARAWKIEAIGALWFDILFQFSPFHFIADMGAMFEIRKGGNCILSIYMSLTLEGPSPWRVQGEGSFKVPGIKVRVSFDKTFGQAQTETIAPVTIHQKLLDAIQNKDNWQVIGPDRSHQVTAFRDITGTTGSNLVVDPFGTLVLSQKVAPMGFRLAKFGTSAISDVTSSRFQTSP
jgi:hypothetical protein